MSERFRYRDLEDVLDRFKQTRPEKPINNGLLVLLYGVSGVGKSTVIRSLVGQYPDRYVYISPYTTRELRPGETDKIHVTDKEYDRLLAEGLFVYSNIVYGVRYGTPKDPLIGAVRLGKVALLDFPLAKADQLNIPENITKVGIYCMPPNLNEWFMRLSGDDRKNWSRLLNGAREIRDVYQSPQKDGVNMVLLMETDQASELVKKVNDFVISLL